MTIWHGDLLFVGAQSKNLSGAINRVTQRTSSAAFDHIGLIEIAHGLPHILHASSKKGSVKEPLDSLLKNNHDDDRLFAIYRIDSIYQNAIPEAIARARQMLGKPYNWSYTLNDSSYYCSDFVERAFRHIALFQLEPMTFKNPKTGDFDEFWKIFYANQGLEVPEGELGCNPNGMAASRHIHYVGSFHTRAE
ncbi:hypothetical protein C5745_18655 [Sphingobacterium haloxyli]|uniref:Permuted papain-like amidase YaeF/Yiix C92 family enzyme n=1 Tax=Sphingobacterium haloxyli TaxID=2100533 RepID=A0A2S9IX05_9SPHI|nr:hypothetical protein C5745_18655 [Sphingobacterium haloxyli]